MFPKLDSDLSSIANHFRFDHLTITTDTDDADSSDVKTPLQMEHSKQFPIVREMMDDEEDEPTISMDYTIEHDDFKPPKSPGIVSTAAKVLEDIINKSEKRQPGDPIRKQKSLHESESHLSLVTLRRNLEFSRFLSVDQRSISDTEDNVTNDTELDQTNCKTQSCANLKLSCTAPHSPCSIAMRGKYIENSKRVSHSFHGKPTAPMQKDGLVSTSSMDNVIKPNTRFTTVKIDETQLGQP